MGCERSKFDKEICAKNETPEMHLKYIDKFGIQKYYEVMGMPLPEAGKPTIDDHSKTINLGLVNVDTKSETATSNKFMVDFNWKMLVEIAVGLLIILYVTCRLVRYCKKKRQKSKMKKSSKLKEILQDANKPTAPPENPFKQTFPVAIPTTKMNPSYGNREIALQVLQDPQKNQLVPIFSSNLYD